MTKTWQQRIGKRLMKHVKEETHNARLYEVKQNLQYQSDSGCYCFECAKIAKKLGLPYHNAVSQLSAD